MTRKPTLKERVDLSFALGELSGAIKGGGRESGDSDGADRKPKPGEKAAANPAAHVWDSHKHDAELHARIRELEARVEELEDALKACIDETPACWEKEVSR